MIFSQRQPPASQVLQETVSSPDVCVQQLVEVRAEGVLLVRVDPVERSLAVGLNTVQPTRVGLHPEVTEKFLQFPDRIIFQILNIITVTDSDRLVLSTDLVHDDV